MTKRKIRFFQKQTVIYVITVLLSILYVVVGNQIASRDLTTAAGADTRDPLKAKVINILSRNDRAENGSDNGVIIITFEATVLSGERKGQTVTAIQQIDSVYPVKLKEVEKNDRILLYEDTTSEIHSWIMGEYVRFDPLLILGLLFGVGLLIFGRLKGVNTIVSLAFTCLSVFVVFIPAVMSGQNIYFWSILTCIFITVMTLLIVNGANRKSLAAGIGCFSGVSVAGLITLIMDGIIHLTGWLDESSMNLYVLNPEHPIDLKAIIFAGIIIGAIGAIMDVAMSLSSSLQELKIKLPTASWKTLFRSGITIGRDIMGTMANTLVLAYIGSSLSMTLLIVAYTGSMTALLNREAIIVEILNALAGSIGILLTIPLTSMVCALLYAGRKETPTPSEEETPPPKKATPQKAFFVEDAWEDSEHFDGI